MINKTVFLDYEQIDKAEKALGKALTELTQAELDEWLEDTVNESVENAEFDGDDMFTYDTEEPYDLGIDLMDAMKNSNY